MQKGKVRAEEYNSKGNQNTLAFYKFRVDKLFTSDYLVWESDVFWNPSLNKKAFCAVAVINGCFLAIASRKLTHAFDSKHEYACKTEGNR